MPVNIKIVVFRDHALCGLVDWCQRFGSKFCLYL